MLSLDCPYSETLPLFKSRSAIILSNWLLPDPEGPCTVRHSPLASDKENGPAQAEARPRTSSAGNDTGDGAMPACARAEDIDIFLADNWVQVSR
jgi:hypothetical protein